MNKNELSIEEQSQVAQETLQDVVAQAVKTPLPQPKTVRAPVTDQLAAPTGELVASHPAPAVLEKRTKTIEELEPASAEESKEKIAKSKMRASDAEQKQKLKSAGAEEKLGHDNGWARKSFLEFFSRFRTAYQKFLTPLAPYQGNMLETVVNLVIRTEEDSQYLSPLVPLAELQKMEVFSEPLTQTESTQYWYFVCISMLVNSMLETGLTEEQHQLFLEKGLKVLRSEDISNYYLFLKKIYFGGLNALVAELNARLEKAGVDTRLQEKAISFKAKPSSFYPRERVYAGGMKQLLQVEQNQPGLPSELSARRNWRVRYSREFFERMLKFEDRLGQDDTINAGGSSFGRSDTCAQLYETCIQLYGSIASTGFSIPRAHRISFAGDDIFKSTIIEKNDTEGAVLRKLGLLSALRLPNSGRLVQYAGGAVSALTDAEERRIMEGAVKGVIRLKDSTTKAILIRRFLEAEEKEVSPERHSLASLIALSSSPTTMIAKLKAELVAMDKRATPERIRAIHADMENPDIDPYIYLKMLARSKPIASTIGAEITPRFVLALKKVLQSDNVREIKAYLQKSVKTPYAAVAKKLLIETVLWPRMTGRFDSFTQYVRKIHKLSENSAANMYAMSRSVDQRFDINEQNKVQRDKILADLAQEFGFDKCPISESRAYTQSEVLYNLFVNRMKPVPAWGWFASSSTSDEGWVGQPFFGDQVYFEQFRQSVLNLLRGNINLSKNTIVKLSKAGDNLSHFDHTLMAKFVPRLMNWVDPHSNFAKDILDIVKARKPTIEASYRNHSRKAREAKIKALGQDSDKLQASMTTAMKRQPDRTLDIMLTLPDKAYEVASSKLFDARVKDLCLGKAEISDRFLVKLDFKEETKSASTGRIQQGLARGGKTTNESRVALAVAVCKWLPKSSTLFLAIDPGMRKGRLQALVDSNNIAKLVEEPAGFYDRTTQPQLSREACLSSSAEDKSEFEKAIRVYIDPPTSFVENWVKNNPSFYSQRLERLTKVQRSPWLKALMSDTFVEELEGMQNRFTAADSQRMGQEADQQDRLVATRENSAEEPGLGVSNNR